MLGSVSLKRCLDFHVLLVVGRTALLCRLNPFSRNIPLGDARPYSVALREISLWGYSISLCAK